MREPAATNAEIEALTKIKEEEFCITIDKTDTLGLPQDDAHSRIGEYLKSQLQSITNDSSPKPTAETENPNNPSSFKLHSETKVISTTKSEVVASSYQSPGVASGFQNVPSTSISRLHAETNVT